MHVLIRKEPGLVVLEGFSQSVGYRASYSEVVGGNKEVDTGQCKDKMTKKSSYIRTNS